MVVSQAVIEDQFTEQFKASLNGSGESWLDRLRRDAFAAFNDLGFPIVKSEDWKYTNVAPIGKEKWKVRKVGSNAGELDGKFGDLLKRFNYERNGFTALNLAFGEVVAITIPKETKLDEPIEISFADLTHPDL